MGEEEIKNATCQVKDTRSGNQITMSQAELLAPFSFV
jgi:hypothetical protein